MSKSAPRYAIGTSAKLSARQKEIIKARWELFHNSNVSAEQAILLITTELRVDLRLYQA